MTYDAIVIGVGGMGSATLFHLARAGANVLGIEQFGVAHDRGSSHGSTRIIRLAYSEGSEYVELLRSAYEYWRELETLSAEPILHITGGLDIGLEGSWTIVGSRKSCLDHRLTFEELDAGEVNRRFPGYQLPPSLRAIHQPNGGYVLCERAVQAYAEAAQSTGATLRTDEPVLSWRRDGSGVRVETAVGAYHAKGLVLTAGPWASKLAEPVDQICRPERQVLLWTDPLEAPLFDPARFPVFNMEAPEGRYYGFPNHNGEGFKIGRYHHLEQAVDPDQVDRDCNAEDEAILRKAIDAYFPSANGPPRRMTTCLFTNTPDEHFILDRCPGEPNVWVAAGFSGHGFKFCSVVGKVMADLCLEGRTRWNINPFRLDRPALKTHQKIVP